jgi:hypothetical protein
MNTIKYFFGLPLSLIIISVTFYACSSTTPESDATSVQTRGTKVDHSPNTPKKRTLSKKAQKYWYDGKAEISSYKLTQSRYGELREGSAVLVYVTEPFSKLSNTKANNSSSNNIPVLKLNKTLKFITGIYPYSIMSSSFFPMEKENTSLKIASSQQEWCGMIYMEMKNQGDDIAFNLNSYFEGISFENKVLPKVILEDDIWSWIRLNPELLPTGQQEFIPTMSVLVLNNKAPKTYTANATLKKEANGISSYTLTYSETGRALTIQFQTAFPHQILGWEEKYYSNYGSGEGSIVSKGERINTIKSAYWGKSSNQDTHWRDTLGL